MFQIKPLGVFSAKRGVLGRLQDRTFQDRILGSAGLAALYLLLPTLYSLPSNL